MERCNSRRRTVDTFPPHNIVVQHASMLGLSHALQISCIEPLDMVTRLCVEATCRELSATVRRGSSLWREVHLSSPRLTDESLASLLQRMNCMSCTTRLTLSQCLLVTGSGIEPLQGSTCLRVIDLCTDSRGKSSNDDSQWQSTNVGWQAGPNIDFKIIASVLTPMLQHSLERVIVRRKPERLHQENTIARQLEVPDVWHAWEHPEILYLQQQLTGGTQCPACLEEDAPRCSGRNCGCRSRRLAGAVPKCRSDMVHCDNRPLPEPDDIACDRWYCFESIESPNDSHDSTWVTLIEQGQMCMMCYEIDCAMENGELEYAISGDYVNGNGDVISEPEDGWGSFY